MKTESELCVDALLVKTSKIEDLVEKLSSERDDELLCQARDLYLNTQSFISNNKSLIPSYCLKKVTDSLRKLDSYISEPQKTKLQFKFKSVPKVVAVSPEKSLPLEENDKVEINLKDSVSTPFFGFRDCQGKKLELNELEVESKDISLINLINCDVNIVGIANTIYIRNLEDTSVTVCLACRAIAVINCNNCQLKLICQQLRIDSTSKCTFKIYTSARSMLESSRELEFHRLSLDSLEDKSAEQVRDLLIKANFDEQNNNWKCIDDFDWLSPDSASKNYKIVE